MTPTRTTEEENVQVRTPDGVCDAAFIHPNTGSYPGVLFWPDAFGLRPSMREMATRLAAEGYAVLVPNPYYRVSAAPFTDASTFNLATDIPKLTPYRASIEPPGAAERDAVAYVAFLDARKEVENAKKIGTQGYCMGGALVMRTCAAVPDRVGAGASFHGGGLVTDKPGSPHLLAPKIKARMYFAFGKNDDERQPEAKNILREAFPGSEVEVYGSLHGWCIRDMPPNADGPIYNEPDARRAWAKLLALYSCLV